MRAHLMVFIIFIFLIHLLHQSVLGGWHRVATKQIKKLGAVLARHRGEDEQVEVRHLFQRLSLLLMRGNATLLLNRVPEDDAADAMVDGIE